MKYFLVQQDNTENTWYYVMDDAGQNVIKVIDMDCNEVEYLGVPHGIVDTNPTPPPCAQQ
jgi:hypothetical protein